MTHTTYRIIPKDVYTPKTTKSDSPLLWVLSFVCGLAFTWGLLGYLS